MRLQLWKGAQVRRAARDPRLRQTERQISESQHSPSPHPELEDVPLPLLLAGDGSGRIQSSTPGSSFPGHHLGSTGASQAAEGQCQAQGPHQLPWHRLQHCHLLWESSTSSIIMVPLSKGMQFPGYSVSKDIHTYAFPLHFPANSNSLLEGGCHKKQEVHYSICTIQLLNCWVL